MCYLWVIKSNILTTAEQKLDLVRWILSIQDERTIQSLTQTRRELDVPPGLEHTEVAGTSYADILNTEFDLDKIIVNQQPKVLSPEERTKLVEEIDIEQSIEDLIEDLD